MKTNRKYLFNNSCTVHFRNCNKDLWGQKLTPPAMDVILSLTMVASYDRGPRSLNVIWLENHLPDEYENLHAQQKNQYWSTTIGRASFRALYSQLSPCKHPAITDTR